MTINQSANEINKAILFTRSLLFSFGMIVSTVVWAPIVLSTFPFSFERRYQIAQQWSRFNIWWLKKTCSIHYHIHGQENIPEKIPAIILAKHQSTWETIFLHQFLPPQAWVIKRELLQVPFFGWAIARLEPIAIDRKAGSTALKQVLRQGQESLDKGRWVVLFPEGTRTAPGKSGRYGMSGAMLAAHSGYPIIPIAHNAGEFWPRRGFIKHPGTIRVVIGPPIQTKNRKAQELNVLTEIWIEDMMKQISNISFSNSRERHENHT